MEDDDKTKLIKLEECYKRTTEDIKDLNIKFDKLCDKLCSNNTEITALLTDTKIVLERVQTNFNNLDYKFVLKDEFSKLKQRMCVIQEEFENNKIIQNQLVITSEDNKIRITQLDERPTREKYVAYGSIAGGLLGIISFIKSLLG